MIIDEFRAVIRINAAQPEGQRLPDLVEGLPHAELALAQHRPGFDPGRVNVGDIQRVQKFAVGAVAGMRHQVDLGEAGLLHIPAVGLQRNLVFQQRAGLRAAILPSAQLVLVRAKAPIDLARTDPADLRLDRLGQAHVPPRPRQPEGQERFQPDRPRIAGGRPDRTQDRHHLRAVLHPRPAAPPSRGRAGRRSSRITALR